MGWYWMVTKMDIQRYVKKSGVCTQEQICTQLGVDNQMDRVSIKLQALVQQGNLTREKRSVPHKNGKYFHYWIPKK